jgi:hypothetical protein
MATKTENVEIAVLQTQMTTVETQLTLLTKAQVEGFAVLNAKLDSVTPLGAKVDTHAKEIEKLKRLAGTSWIKNTGSAGIGALLFFLIQYAIVN